jgi:hypothetical protein
MARTLDAPEDIGSDSIFLSHTEDNIGLHLMIVCEAHEDQKQTKEGLKAFDGISFVCECVGGKGNGKRFNLDLLDGKMTHKDEGKSSKAKQAAMLIATDVMAPEHLGKAISYETTDAEGSLFFVDLALGDPGDNGKRYLNVNYSNIYHVDDPRVKKYKLDKLQEERIKAISKDFRHDEKYFESLLKKKTVEKTERVKFDSDGL